MNRYLLAAAVLGLLIGSAGASAKSFRWANDGDVSSMDPYGRNETLLLSFLGNVYEPLFRRDADLKLEPALAVSSSQPAPDIWRFQLRRNVTFQDGTPFSADDVVFSATRARHPNSRMNTKLARVKEVRKIDDYTVDFVTDGPDPILPEEISDWYIMSKAWAEKNGAVEPADLSKLQEGYASRNANGTGPFMLKEVVFFGFDQMSPVLRSSDIKDRNPFKDVRVRKALYQAIDIEAIKTKVMRGAAVPVGNMIAHGINGFDAEADKRLTYDPAAAKNLLTEAGYPQGFRFMMDCPNDRYVNDGAICEAVAAMFSRIGVKVELNAQTRSKHFGKLLNKETDFYMLGWTPSTYDAHNAIFNLMMTWNDKDQGTNNILGYSNKRVDELGNAIGVELDSVKRNAMIKEALMIHRDEVGHLPLHQQTVVWAARATVQLTQAADNTFPLRFVRLE